MLLVTLLAAEMRGPGFEPRRRVTPDAYRHPATRPVARAMTAAQMVTSCDGAQSTLQPTKTQSHDTNGTPTRTNRTRHRS